MFDERPSDEVIEDDERLDNWLEDYNRKQKEKYQASKLRSSKHG